MHKKSHVAERRKLSARLAKDRAAVPLAARPVAGAGINHLRAEVLFGVPRRPAY